MTGKPVPARGRPSGLTPEIAAEVRRRYTAEPFQTVAEIATALGLAPSTIHSYVRHLGLTRPIRRKSRAEREARRARLVGLLAEVPALTSSQLAQRLGVTLHTVRADCRRLGVSFRAEPTWRVPPVLTWRCTCGGRALSPDGHPACRREAMA